MVTAIGATTVGSPLGGLAYDVGGDVMYAVSAGGSSPRLYTIDLASGAATLIGTASVPGAAVGGLTALEFGSDGVLYTLTNQKSSFSGHLFSIDPVTAQMSNLGNTGGGALSSLTTATQIPEPGTLALLVLGAGGLVWRVRRRKK